MPGEGEGPVGGGGEGGSGSGGSGGGDVGDILRYLNHRGFGNDGDYTGNAGYGGDNTGPPGSKEPDKDTHPSTDVPDVLMAPPGKVPGAPQRPGHRSDGSRDIEAYGGGEAPNGSVFHFAGADVDVFSGRPWDFENPDPFTGLPASDPFADADWPTRARREGPFGSLRQTGLLSSPYLLADNSAIARDSNLTSRLPDVKSDFGATPPGDWQDEIKRLAGEQRNGPALVFIDGQLRSLPSYTTKELVIRAGEENNPAPLSPVPPQQPPPAPDHRYGLYIFKKAEEQASEQSRRAFKEGRYFEAAVGWGLREFLGSIAQLENLMPYNAPDHFLSAGQYAKRWMWYDMRGQSGRGLLELAMGHSEAGAALAGVDLAFGAAKSLTPSGFQLNPALATTERGTKMFLNRGILRVQKNTGNAYSYDSRTNKDVVAKILTKIDADKPGAAIYVGTGGHANWAGKSFVTEMGMRDPRFIAEDQATVKALQEIGIGKVLDLSDPVHLQIFKNAEQMAVQPGQDAVFTVRAWCFSTRTCL